MTAATRKRTDVPAVDQDEVKAALAKIDERRQATDAPADAAPAETDAAPAESTTDETATATTVEDPFAELEDAVEAEYTRGRKAEDVDAITSPHVKRNLQASFDKYEPARSADGEILVNKPGKSDWRTLRFATAEQGAVWQKQAKKYATFREWTFRSGWQNDTTLRFCAKPKETKKTV